MSCLGLQRQELESNKFRYFTVVNFNSYAKIQAEIYTYCKYFK
jgi:hypothetical protein